MSNNRGSGSAATPVITTASGQDIGTVSEDGTLKTTGRLSAVETGSSHPDLDWSVVGNGHGTYGSFSIDDNGKWSYALNNKSDAVQSLAAGEHVSETFNVRVSDGHGGLATETVTIDVVGTNDAPEITGGTSAGAVKEDGTLTASGHLNATDVDHGAQLSWAVVNGGAGTYGTLAVDQNGNWTYQLDNNSAAVQSLRGSDKVTETFLIKVTDEFGASDTQTVTVKIQGTDDAPIIVGTATGAVTEDGTATASGQLSILEIDRHDSRHDDHRDDGHGSDDAHGDNHDHNGYDGHDNDDGSAWSVIGGGAGTYGTLSVDATGQWTYALANDAANVQALSAGETHTETFTVQFRIGEHDEADGHDDHAGHDGHDHDTATYITQTVNVTVTGTNDAPVITSTVQSGAVQEDSVLTATGQVTASDIDHLDVLSYAVQGDGNGTYGSLAVDTSTGQWTYTLNNGADNVQALSAGESHTETFTVLVSDGQGGVVSQDVNVTVTGTNDVPVITSAAQVGAAQEDSVLIATGQVTASDVDHLDTLSYAVVGDGAGTYGSFAVDSATGQWTYTLNNDAANVQALSAGENHTETFTVQVSDGQGGITSQDVAVTVTGTNDVPVIASADQSGALQEDSVLTATGQVTASDIDHLDVLSYAVAGDGNGTYGSLAVDPATGQWTYTLNNGDSNVQSLAQGETVQDSFTVQVSDGNGGTTSQEVDVTIAGTNDAPVAFDAAATADQNTPVTFGLSHYDPDTTDTDTVTLFETVNFSSSGSALGSLGSTEHDVTDGYLHQGGHAVLNGDGTVTFDPGHDFDYLGAGQTQDVVFDYRVTDSFGATTTAAIDVTVTGENDAPVAYDTSATADQNAPTTVYLPWYEPDQGDTDTVVLFENYFGGSQSSASYASSGSFGGSEHDFTDGYLNQGGHATLNADGTVTFDPGHAFDYLGAGQTQDVVFGYRVTDSFGATTTATIDVTVTGENDAPVAYDTSATADQNTPTTVYLPWYEPDQNDTDTVTLFETVNFSSSGSLGGSTEHDVTDGYLHQGGHAVLNGDGTVTFDPGHDFDYLGAGQTQDVVFDYRVTDSFGATTTATIDVTVTGENDAPVITSEQLTGTVTDGPPPPLTGTTLSGVLTADNNVALYISTDDSVLGTLVTSGNDWTTAYAFSSAALTTGVTNYIHVVAGNGGGPGGFIGEFHLSNGQMVFTNGSTDEYTTPADWNVSLTGEGSNYTTPANEGANGIGPWGFHSGISSSSDWLWSYVSNNGYSSDYNTDYFSMAVKVAPPELVASGTITFNDADLTDSHLVSATGTPIGSVLGTLTATLNSDTTGTGTGGEMTWTYDVANSAVAYLAAGETKVESFTITLDDQHGGLITKEIDVTINGSNDAPTITSDTAAASGAISELANTSGSSAVDSAGGTITFGDVDLSNTHTVTQAAPIFALSSGYLTQAQIDALTAASTLSLSSTDSTNTGNGSVGWTYTVTDGALDFLAAGQTVTASYGVTVTDSSGATALQNIAVTITGTNDAPVIASGGDTSGAVLVNTTETAAGQLSASDVDNGAILGWSVENGGTGTYGTLAVDQTGHWTYTLDNSASDVQAIPDGQHVADSFLVDVTDEFGATATETVAIDITGAHVADPIVASDGLTANAIAGGIGVNGAAGTSSLGGAGTGGGNGTAGSDGSTLDVVYTAQILNGDTGNDTLATTLIANGAIGGTGGIGGIGGDSGPYVVTSTNSSTYYNSQGYPYQFNYYTTYDEYVNYSGASGGAGGAGGSASSMSATDQLDIIAGSGGADSLTLDVESNGANGGTGGDGGAGGNTGPDGYYDYSYLSGYTYTQTGYYSYYVSSGWGGGYYQYQAVYGNVPDYQYVTTNYHVGSGVFGGAGGDGGAGGNGSDSVAQSLNNSVFGGDGNDTISASAVALAGNGGHGGAGGMGGYGPDQNGGIGGHGGDGGMGGDASAVLVGNTLDGGAGDDTVTLSAIATAGNGGDGGSGGAAGLGQYVAFYNGGTTTFYNATGGAGGDGGAFGTASIDVNGNILNGGDGNDVLTLSATLTGGTSGAGGTGGGAGTSSSYSISDTYGTHAYQYVAGVVGSDGGSLTNAGSDQISIVGNMLSGGNGDDTLKLQIDATNAHNLSVTVDGNMFDGGAGNNTLDLSHVDIAGVSVDLGSGVFTVDGAAGTNTVLNIQSVIGTSFADTLAGNGFGETLFGGGGNDLFAFHTSGNGNSTVGDFQSGVDFIELIGTGFTSAADALAHTVDDGHGNAVIQIDAHDTVTIANTIVASLHASDYLLA